MLRILKLLLLAQLSKALYNAMKSEVMVISQTNWMNQIVKGRQNDNIFLIHFIEGDDKVSNEFSKEFTLKAEEYKGIFTFGFVDCRKNSEICKKEGLNKFPSLRIYPPMPLPYETIEMNIQTALNRASSFINSFITEVNDDNINGFINTEATLPKVLFFTDKPGISLLLKALSKNFNKKLIFGIIRSDSKEVIKSYNIKKFPQLLVIKSGHKKPFVFEKELKYKEIFEFLNFFSEQFVPSNNEKTADSKPWLFEAIPELTEQSGNEICFSLEKVLCVILFSPKKPEKTEIEVLKELKFEFDNKQDRAASYKFVWINSSVNSFWNSEFQISNPDVLNVRVLNPGRRKRYVMLESSFNYQNVKKLLEKISGGDARFIPLKGEVPAFSKEL